MSLLGARPDHSFRSERHCHWGERYLSGWRVFDAMATTFSTQFSLRNAGLPANAGWVLEEHGVWVCTTIGTSCGAVGTTASIAAVTGPFTGLRLLTASKMN